LTPSLLKFLVFTAVLLAALAVNAPWSFGWISEGWIDLSPLLAVATAVFLVLNWRGSVLGRLVLVVVVLLFLKPSFEALRYLNDRADETPVVAMESYPTKAASGECFTLPPQGIAVGVAEKNFCGSEKIRLWYSKNRALWIATTIEPLGDPITSLAEDTYDALVVKLAIGTETLTIAATALPDGADLNRSALTTRRLALQLRHLSTPALAIIRDEEGPISKRHRRFVEAAKLAPLDQLQELGRALISFEPRWQLWGRGVAVSSGEWQEDGALVWRVKIPQLRN
jgi:hypothetical protein